MTVNRLFRNGITLGYLVLILCVTLAFGQSEEVSTGEVRQVESISETTSAVQTIDPAVDAEFTARIEQIRADAVASVSNLESAMQSTRGEDKESYNRQIEQVNLDAEIAILEVRYEQEMARGNPEFAAKFQEAAEMLRNPAPRQAPDPAVDEARFDQHRSQQDNTR